FRARVAGGDSGGNRPLSAAARFLHQPARVRANGAGRVGRPLARSRQDEPPPNEGWLLETSVEVAVTTGTPAGGSGVAATLRQCLAHSLRDDPRQLADEAVNGRLQTADRRLQITDGRLQAADSRLQTIHRGLQHVDLAFDSVEPGLDSSKIVAVAPGLLQDVAGLPPFGLPPPPAHPPPRRPLLPCRRDHPPPPCAPPAQH